MMTAACACRRCLGACVREGGRECERECVCVCVVCVQRTFTSDDRGGERRYSTYVLPHSCTIHTHARTQQALVLSWKGKKKHLGFVATIMRVAEDAIPLVRMLVVAVTKDHPFQSDVVGVIKMYNGVHA